MTQQQHTLWPFILLPIVLSIITGMVDLLSVETYLPFALLVLGSLVFGYMNARWAWAWALIMGLGIPSVHLAAGLLHIATGFIVEPGLSTLIMTLLPALVGAYSGAAFRYLTRA